jgi:hypothetical protein
MVTDFVFKAVDVFTKILALLDQSLLIKAGDYVNVDSQL